ncbi:MAG: hypothetical protein IBX47_05060 [Desulfuromonadales bacterium]|nr:hypothetical protein [Desulfuromonadales bacterium]
MVVGFNHNFRYRGEVFHVQTEDGGLNTTNIITLLYRGGTILARQKTSYADIAKVDNLDKVVEELMKEQHKEMLKRLKTGEFDQRVDEILAGKKTVPAESAAAATVSAAEPVIAIKPEPAAPPTFESPQPVVEDEYEEAIPILEEDIEEAETEFDLDDVILSYLMGGKDK